jgi:hypothetical protein
MTMKIFLSPPFALAFYLFLLYLGYSLIQQHAAKGLDHPEKYLPYSGGQKIPPRVVRMSYKTFFRLGLLFGIVHVAVLVLATLPLGSAFLWIGLLYLVGVSISAVVLSQTKPS